MDELNKNMNLNYEEITKFFDIDDELNVDHTEEESDTLPQKLSIIESDDSFLSEIQQGKKSRKKFKDKKIRNDGKVREILLLRESQVGIVNFYLNSFNMAGFKYFESTSHFKTISGLKENLLNDPYWVIATLGKRHSLTVPKLKYNFDVIDKYLNHIIISNNWNLLKEMDKEDFTITIDFYDKAYSYKLKFLSTLDEEVLFQYVQSKLVGQMNNFQIERVCSFLFSAGKKNLVENLDKFINMKGYSFEEIVNSIKSEKNISYQINELVNAIVKKKKKKWREYVSEILYSHGEKYLIKALQNNFSNLYKLKVGESINSLNKEYLKKLVDSVDLLDLTYLKSILEEKEFVYVLLYLEDYMNKPTKLIIIR